MTREEKYDAVNSAKTFIELADIIESFADKTGNVRGRSRFFNAKEMADKCRNFPMLRSNSLTKEFGIRQQAMMIEHYAG